jgi:hypothetical protein
MFDRRAAGDRPLTARRATFHCVATLSLADGQLTSQGLVTFTEAPEPRFRIAVTGGTGAYRTAHGEVAVLETAAGRNDVTVTVIR